MAGSTVESHVLRTATTYGGGIITCCVLNLEGAISAFPRDVPAPSLKMKHILGRLVAQGQ